MVQINVKGPPKKLLGFQLPELNLVVILRVYMSA